MPKTLLLADDSVTIQKVVGISFANEDVTITTVDNGDDAIAKARELRPDVILADVVMPGKSGYEVCEAVKADADLRRTPVLLLTGTFEAFDEERAARAGAAGHVAKPFEAQTLVERVKELLAEAAAAPPPAAAPAPAAAAPEPRASAAPQPPASAPPPRSVEAPTNPELGSDQAFDFFDDNAGELSEPHAAGSLSDDALDLDEADAAFAFGEEDLGAVTQEPLSATPLASREPAPDSTIAMLPEEAPAEASGRPEADADEDLDLRLDGGAAAGATGGASAQPVEGDDLAQATLLDPAAGSGFDVSSSDLASEASPGLRGADPASEASLGLRGADPASEPPAGPPAELPHDPVMERLTPEPPGAPAPSAPEDSAALGAPRPTTSDPAAAWNAEPPADMRRPWGAEDHLPPAGDAAEEASVWPEEPEDADDAEPLELEPEPDLPPARPATTPPSAAPVGDAPRTPLSPAMREELNATLEKIAWDAFGQVTEKIVAEALERIEQVAWEVIPKLAETLIQEEIRRLRDENAE